MLSLRCFAAICVWILAAVLVKTRHIEDGYGIKRELGLILASSVGAFAVVAAPLTGAMKNVVMGFVFNIVLFATVTWPVIRSYVHQRRIEGRGRRTSRRSGEPALREVRVLGPNLRGFW